MKVLAIANFSLLRVNTKINDNGSRYYHKPVVIPFDTFERTTFTSKGPEDVNPSRKAFDRLDQEILTCPCCGRNMIPPHEIEDLRTSKALKCKAPQAIKVLSQYENKMHSVEKEVFNILKVQAKAHPDMDFKEILELIKPEYEKPLIKTQLGIFTLIEKAAESMDTETREQINELLNETKGKLYEGNNEFRRKRFVTKFEEILGNKKNTAYKEHIVRIAKKLPTAYEDKNAFIVKYSSRSAEEIGIRLLSYSMRTIEHVKPKNRFGENHLFNYIPECMRCNSFRQDRPMIQQLEEYPEMFVNAQNLMDKLVDAANRGEINKWYILKIQQNIYYESEKTLKLDISKLRIRRNMYNEFRKINKNEPVLFEEDIREHRLSKKQLKRQKVKERHNQKAKNKKDKTNRI